MRDGATSCVVLLVLLLAGCATLDTELQLPDDFPAAQRLDVPFYAQRAYHCGPAALAGALQFYGVSISPEELAGRVYLPGRQGSLTLEMQAAARRSGLLAYPLRAQPEALLQELAVGHPVLVLQNLGFDWWPQWHYALAVGFEERGQTLLLHSGEQAYYHLPLSTFVATWRRAQYWARVVVPPTVVPLTAEPLSYLAAASDLRRSGQGEAARAAYRAALLRWPERADVQFALANSAFEQGEYREAYQHYRRSVELRADFAAAWNNLAFTLQALGCSGPAMQAVSRARELAPEDVRYRDSAAELSEQAAADRACVLKAEPRAEDLGPR